MASTRTIEAHFSFTELAEYRRLVRFLNDAEDMARLYADDDLRELVEECRSDLRSMKGRPE